jgi:hypothetical protein
MADDDLLLDASDLADIFGDADDGGGEDLAKSIEDLFLSDPSDEDADAPSSGAALPSGEADPSDDTLAAFARQMAAEEPKAAPAPVEAFDEPELAEPDRGGMTEEEWRASAQYSEFKKQVIARHLRKKAAEEAARQRAEAEAAQAAQAAAQQAAAAAQARSAEQEAAAKADAERKKQELLEKYKAAKAGAIAQRAQAMVQAADAAGSAAQAADAEKAAKLKEHLAALKAKMAAGGLPPLTLQAKALAPKLSEASQGLDLDVVKAKALAAMFEETRTEMLKHVSDSIGKKPAQAMMKKTLAKVAKLHLDVYGRAAIDSKNELRVDGALDEERLTRAIYGLPAAERLAKVQKAFYELIEMRFIAVELGLGHKAQATIVSKTLHALEDSFKRKGYAGDLVKWYFDDVIPSTALADSDDGGY